MVAEFKEIVDSVVQARVRGKGLTRDTVYDRTLQEGRLRLIQELQACPAGLCTILK